MIMICLVTHIIEHLCLKVSETTVISYIVLHMIIIASFKKKIKMLQDKNIETKFYD